MADLVDLGAAASTGAPLTHLARLLEHGGWEIRDLDIDLTGEHARLQVTVARHDGLWVWARVDQHGRCTMERFRRTLTLGMTPRTSGRRPLSPQVEDEFMGRQSFPGPRMMLRSLVAYLADNALQQLAVSDLRDAWRGVLQAPVRLIDQAERLVTASAQCPGEENGQHPARQRSGG